MMVYICSAILLNLFSFFVAKTLQGGKFVLEEGHSHGRKMYLIAGFMAQPEKVYDKVQIPFGERVYLRYSLMGFNVKNAGEQLHDLFHEGDIVLGISIGCKAIICSHRDDIERVMINPATHSIALKSKYQVELKYAWMLVALSYLLGWLSALPIIRTKNGNYSFALLADQMLWLYYGDPEYKEIGSLDKTSMIVSRKDQYIDRFIIKSIFRGSKLSEIDTRHGELLREYIKYEKALKTLVDR